jgi:hypothetical protein
MSFISACFTTTLWSGKTQGHKLRTKKYDAQKTSQDTDRRPYSGNAGNVYPYGIAVLAEIV